MEDMCKSSRQKARVLVVNLWNSAGNIQSVHYLVVGKIRISYRGSSLKQEDEVSTVLMFQGMRDQHFGDELRKSLWED